jgi:apolipoprotein N-acyltransferase
MTAYSSEVMIISWSEIKDRIILGVLCIGILWMSYVAINSLLAGQIWNLLFLILVLMYFATYFGVFVIFRNKFGSRLQYQVAFVIITWVFIALLLGVELMKSGTLRQMDGLKAAVGAVVAAVLLSPDETAFLEEKNSPPSSLNASKTIRYSSGTTARQTPSIYDYAEPVKQDPDSNEYQPYSDRKNGRSPGKK